MPTPEDYYGKVKFKDYDAYLIFTKSRFTAYDKQLAKKLKLLNKPFLFIRTHIDVDLKNESEKEDFTEEKTLKMIKKDCLKNLRDLITSDEDVFLISNKVREKCEFVRLTQAILNLPTTYLIHSKKENLFLSLKAFSNARDVVKQKADFLRGNYAF